MASIRRVYVVLLLVYCASSWSEVTLDGSIGSAGALTGLDYQITENLGQRAGSNLFHSFGQFNLETAESATFSGNPDIQNIISCVTGCSPFSIDGALRSTIPNANLYFLNPAGQEERYLSIPSEMIDNNFLKAESQYHCDPDH